MQLELDRGTIVTEANTACSSTAEEGKRATSNKKGRTTEEEKEGLLPLLQQQQKRSRSPSCIPPPPPVTGRREDAAATPSDDAAVGAAAAMGLQPSQPMVVSSSSVSTTSAFATTNDPSQRQSCASTVAVSSSCANVSSARGAEVMIIDDDDEGTTAAGGRSSSNSLQCRPPAAPAAGAPAAAVENATSPTRTAKQTNADDPLPPLKAPTTERRSRKLSSNSSINHHPSDDPLSTSSCSASSPLGAVPSPPCDAPQQPAKAAAAASKPSSSGKTLKQSTLAFGISMEGELRKSLAEKDAKIEELSSKLHQMEESARVKEAELRSALRQREGEISAVVAAHEKAAERTLRYQQALCAILTENARSDRQEARRCMWETHNELGHVVMVPSSVGVKEMWVEGSFWRQSMHEAETLAKRKSEVETLKKAAEKKLKSTAKSNSAEILLQQQQSDESNGFSFTEMLMEAEESFELYKQELDALERQLVELQKKRDQHEVRKATFLREIRRIQDEDASEFSHMDTLQEGRYVMMNLLGKGGFSEVWKAFDLVGARFVAVKIHKVSREMNAQTRANYLKHAERELEIMRQLDHMRLVKLYDVFELNEHTFASSMELSQGCDLDAHLKSHRFLKEHDARVILIQMVSALRYLADLENPIIHYDLKPANIIFHSRLSSSLDIKIADFGLSKIIMQEGMPPGGEGGGGQGGHDPLSIELTSQGTGTFWYLPPETFETTSTPRISNKVDIWAVGVIFFQMLFGKRPFAEGENQRRIWHDKLIVQRAKQLEFPPVPPGQKAISNEAKELIRKCLTVDVHDRIDIVQLSNDPYLRKKSIGVVGGNSAGVSSGGAPSGGRRVVSVGPSLAPVAGLTLTDMAPPS